MFVREKRIGAYSYLYLVETVRENGCIKQRISRKEVMEARGDLDRLARSATRAIAALDDHVADRRRRSAGRDVSTHRRATAV
jgi:hypothetical protein